ncbi:hypothetical protein, conserved [Leishmania tarentolae]|uniref:Trypanosoma Tc-38 (p38) protein domain-containing protein n=1 Tax=Leishmania tarentolae TaxID=5689 RepID=A0A640KED2_LEITA|nr:hypothetical protein, conserved [Leishmania tarentolae]
MFSSHRAAQRFCGGCALARRGLPAAALHPSRTLRLYANTLAGMSPKTVSSLHVRDSTRDDFDTVEAGSGPLRAVGGDWDADIQRDDGHGVRVEGGELTYPVSVVHAHTVAKQATAALQSLLGHSRLPSSAAVVDADGDDRISAVEAPVAHKRICDADTVRRDAAGPHFSTEGAGPVGGDAMGEDACLSHGEEELQECAEAFADEEAMMGVEEASTGTAAAVTPPLQGIAPDHQKSAGRQTTESPDATQYSAGYPLNLRGARYWGSTALAMRSAAETRGFVSPFWASRRGFEDAGVTVTAAEEEGVLASTSSLVSVRLFNLEQTTLASKYRCATVDEVTAHLRLEKARHDTSLFLRGLRNTPHVLDIAGGCLPFSLAAAITASLHFARLQVQSPYWLSEHDVQVIGAAVRPEEVKYGVLVPHSLLKTSWQSTLETAAHAELSASARVGAPATTVSDEEASSDAARSMKRYYNVAQLDDQERFARLNPVRDRLARCVNYRGNRYRPSTTWLMWEYCARHNFPLTDMRHIVFITMEKLTQLGGRVVWTKPYPTSCTHAGRDDVAAVGISSRIRTSDAARVSSTPPSSSAAVLAFKKMRATPHRELDVVPACGGQSARGGTDDTSSRAADGGVDPPLFTMVISDEVVCLCNAVQTDIADLLIARANELRKTRYWKQCLQL